MNVYFINTAGEIALEISDYQVAGNFHEGFAPVVHGDYFFGFIDKTGKLAIETPFVEIRNFSDGLAVVKTQEKGFYGQAQTKWGAIDKTGCLVFEGEFDKLYSFSEEVAIAEKGQEMFFLNKLGDITRSFNRHEIYVEYNLTKRFSEGLIAVRDAKSGLAGFMNKDGEYAITPRFESAANFSEGLARVSIVENQQEYLGFINPRGEFAIDPKFNVDHDFLRCSNDFSEGLASVIDGLPTMEKNPGFMFIDRSGEIVLQTDFFSAEPFHEGLSAVSSPTSGIYGYIDKSGELAIPLKYYFASNFSEGLALVA